MRGWDTFEMAPSSVGFGAVFLEPNSLFMMVDGLNGSMVKREV